ncbi:hypothetical protein BD309DRAFT_964790 [Dichomitus squalens]|uniref:Uncharacterized protein n=1 Tax=Dichomitus squalens TaxID=114155 RepID=A0A4Q9Q9T5_9APHY|nr:hypothetical protein BD309DRAFT_964790 [Dichomitus squalens]TBU64319.1 hypothetical protein BD310DRAFT_914434 [Dichomitus squalens]
MAYNYYQNQAPGWGTAQFQFGAPPVPAFHPQPTWRGYDFYNAHASNPDPGLFDSIMGRLREVVGLGIGHTEARHWHKKIYSGMVPLTQLLPADIGAAAAYEAYRTWKYNSFLHEPLSADRETQREGLIGMAIAETQRLWQYSGRGLDTYGLRNACEAAASAGNALADRLFNSYGGGIGRSPSFSSSGDPYGYDDPYHRHGGRSRRNSFSNPAVVRVGGSPMLSSAVPSYAGSVSGALPMPISGQAMGPGSPYGAGMPGSYGAYGTPYAASSQPGLPGSYGYGSGSLSGRVSPSPYGTPQPMAGGYTYNGMPVGGYAGSASPYGGAAQQGGYVLPNGQTAPPGSTIIINHRPRRHSSVGRHHHHRSGSDYDDEWDRGRERERERADRERHERDRQRWEQEELARQQYGQDEYGRYGRVGSGMGGGGYGYGGRY